MTKQGKIWGLTEEVFNNGNISINFLKIKKGGYCSEHKHKKKLNLFYVISGKLSIMIWRDDKKDETIIESGQSTIVEAGVYHKFWAMSDVQCLEIYQAELEKEDIERRTVGGLI